MGKKAPLTPNAWLRHDPIMAALQGVRRGAALLEVGPGQGAFGQRLARRFRYLGVESDPDAAAVAGQRVTPQGGRVVIGDAIRATSGQRFAVVCAFEVLEHLPDDLAAAKAWVERLEPGGRLVVSVPAGPHRMGPWDEAVGHYRRYDRAALTRVLQRAGLRQVQIRATGMPLGYLLEAVRNRIAARAASDAVLTPGEASTDAVPTDHALYAGRTSSSGRRLQPDRAAWLIALAAAPFRLLQRPFARTNLGTGLVATGVVHHDG